MSAQSPLLHTRCQFSATKDGLRQQITMGLGLAGNIPVEAGESSKTIHLVHQFVHFSVSDTRLLGLLLALRPCNVGVGFKVFAYESLTRCSCWQ